MLSGPVPRNGRALPVGKAEGHPVGLAGGSGAWTETAQSGATSTGAARLPTPRPRCPTGAEVHLSAPRSWASSTSPRWPWPDAEDTWRPTLCDGIECCGRPPREATPAEELQVEAVDGLCRGGLARAGASEAGAHAGGDSLRSTTSIDDMSLSGRRGCFHSSTAGDSGTTGKETRSPEPKRTSEGMEQSDLAFAVGESMHVESSEGQGDIGGVTEMRRGAGKPPHALVC